MRQALRVPAASDLKALARRLGRDRVSWTEATLDRYARDESTRLVCPPDAVVWVSSTADVVETLRWATEGRFPVIPRGRGTGVAGGALACHGGVVLSVERMDRILEVDAANLALTCEPGVVTGRIHERAREAGLLYPPDPASLESCSIGGNVAVGAGGARAVKYGTTRDYVLGAQVVLAEGSVLELGSKNVKDATGYHLLDLLVGSEGTLGVLTRITLRLVPLPACQAALLVPFRDIGGAARLMVRLLRERLVPAVAEFMDDVTIEAARRYLGRDLPGGPEAGAYVFLELEGGDQDRVDRDMLLAGELAEDEGALAVLAAQDPGQQKRLWESRRCLGEALRAWSGEIGKADVVVPRSRVPELVDAVKTIGSRWELVAACFGHAGDGNVHVNLLRCGLDEASWHRRLQGAMDEVMAATRELGGLPSGEHGIGVLKRAELRRFLPEQNVDLMQRIKDSFDPLGILNPGKIF